MLGYVKDSPPAQHYEELADRISEALNFMRACGLDPESHPELRTTDFYTSHEGLLLGYEQAMTRLDFDHRRLVRHLRRTCCGSAIAPASPITPMSSSSAASGTRSASNAARRCRSTGCSG